eukprot:evm.model.scf_1362.1 EVM.evm.TU.scf_1362.1   scf_1362:11640-14995(+)
MIGDGNRRPRTHFRFPKPKVVALVGACLAWLATSAGVVAENASSGNGDRDEPCSLGWGVGAIMLFVQVQLVAVAAYAFNPSGGLGGGGLSRMLKRIGRWMAAVCRSLQEACGCGCLPNWRSLLSFNGILLFVQLQLVAVVAAYPLAGLGRASAWASERTAAVVVAASRWIAGDRASFGDLLAGAIAERERNVELSELGKGGRGYLRDLGVEAIVVSPCAVAGTIRLYVMEGVYEDGERLSSRMLRLYAEGRVGAMLEKAEHPIGQPLGGPECHPGIALRGKKQLPPFMRHVIMVVNFVLALSNTAGALLWLLRLSGLAGAAYATSRTGMKAMLLGCLQWVLGRLPAGLYLVEGADFMRLLAHEVRFDVVDGWKLAGGQRGEDSEWVLLKLGQRNWTQNFTDFRAEHEGSVWKGVPRWAKLVLTEPYLIPAGLAAVGYAVFVWPYAWILVVPLLTLDVAAVLYFGIFEEGAVMMRRRQSLSRFPSIPIFEGHRNAAVADELSSRGASGSIATSGSVGPSGSVGTSVEMVAGSGVSAVDAGAQADGRSGVNGSGDLDGSSNSDTDVDTTDASQGPRMSKEGSMWSSAGCDVKTVTCVQMAKSSGLDGCDVESVTCARMVKSSGTDGDRQGMASQEGDESRLVDGSEGSGACCPDGGRAPCEKSVSFSPFDGIGPLGTTLEERRSTSSDANLIGAIVLIAARHGHVREVIQFVLVAAAFLISLMVVLFYDMFIVAAGFYYGGESYWGAVERTYEAGDTGCVLRDKFATVAEVLTLNR